MRALLAKLKGLWLFVRYIEEFAKNHVHKNEGQLYKFQDCKWYNATVFGRQNEKNNNKSLIWLSNKKGKSSEKEQKFGFVHYLSWKISFITSVF